MGCKIKIDSIEKNLEIDRPSYKFFKEAYDKINTANPNDENLQEVFRQGILKEAKYRGNIPQTKADEVANIESKKIDYISARFAMAGGTPLLERIRYLKFFGKSPNYQNYENTCALQVSYAFNYGGMPIKNLCSIPSGALQGDNEHKYCTGVPKIKELLLNNWKRVEPYSLKNNKDFYKEFCTVKELSQILRKNQETITILNQKRVQELKKENKQFFSTLQNLHQNGIITMDIDGWRDAGGHTTFWDKEMGGFLDETNYLNDERQWVFVRELCFWKI